MTDLLTEISMFMGKNIIAYLHIPLLFLILLNLIRKDKIDVLIYLKIIKWVVITYCAIALISWFFLLFNPSEEYAFINRATGPYYLAYWLMLFFNCVFPFVLLLNRISKNVYLLFIKVLLMNIGRWFEKFVIIITSLHRDYLP